MKSYLDVEIWTNKASFEWEGLEGMMKESEWDERMKKKKKKEICSLVSRKWEGEKSDFDFDGLIGESDSSFLIGGFLSWFQFDGAAHFKGWDCTI